MKLRLRTIENILFMVGFFCILYNPPLLRFNSMHLVGGLSYVYLYFNQKIIRVYFQNIRKIKRVYCIFFLLFAYLFLNVFCHDEPFIFSITPLYFILDIIPFSLAIALFKNKYKLTIENIITKIVIVGLFQAIISIASFLVPSFHQYITGMYLSYGYDSSLDRLFSYRFYGLASGITFAMPILQSFLALLAIYPYKWKNISNCVLSFIILFSAIINARVSIVTFFIGLVIASCYNKTNIINKIKNIIILIVILPVLAKIFSICVEFYSKDTFEWINYGIEELTMFFYGNTDTIYFSYITNIDRYRLPDSLWGRLFGVGHITQGMLERYGYYSDIGYINDIWLGGFIYLILLFSIFYTAANYMYLSNNNIVSFIGVLYMICIPIINFKGISLSMNSFIIFFTIVYFLSLTYRGEDVIKNG